MRWIIKTDDERAESIIKKFVEDFNTEYKNAVKNNKMLQTINLDLTMGYVKINEGFGLFLPLKVPRAVSLLFWGYKKKAVKLLKQMFDKENIKYKEIKYLGD